MVTSPPSCIEAFHTHLIEPAKIRVSDKIAEWRLHCPCGHDAGGMLGYSLAKLNSRFFGAEFVGPLAFRCESCSSVLNILDTDRHGYHAVVSGSGTKFRGSGEPDAFHCKSCANGVFRVVVNFSYWEAALDLVDDEPAAFASHCEDLFSGFTLFGACTACGTMNCCSELDSL